MKSMRKTGFLALLLLTAMMAVSASPLRAPRAGGSLLDYLPDGSGVAVIDFQKIAGSPLWSVINSQDKIKNEIDKAQSEMSDLGVKLTDVHTVALVFPASKMGEPTVALNGGFDQSDVLARLRTNEKFTLTSEQYKGFDVYRVRSRSVTTRTEPGRTTTSRSNDDGYFVFYDASTVVLGSKNSVQSSIDVKTGAAASVTQNSKLSEALAQNPGAAVRFALSITPAVSNGLAASDLPLDFSTISMIFGTVDVGSSLDLNATLRNDNAEHAKSLADRLNGLLSMVNAFLITKDPKVESIAEALKSVSITTVDTDVKITGSLPMNLLSSLLSNATKK
jgi:hypothetical protein